MEQGYMTDTSFILPLKVKDVHFLASGIFCVLEDGRIYERVLDQWEAFMPPLTIEQRTPR